MKILVAGEIVPAPESLRWISDSTPDFSTATFIPDPFFESTLEAALTVAPAMNASVDVVLLDSSGTDTLMRQIFCSEVCDLVHVNGPILLDPLTRAEVILQYAKPFDLILTGWDSLISPSSGLGPYLSRLAGLPLYGPLSPAAPEQPGFYDWFSGEQQILPEDGRCVVSVRYAKRLRYPSLQEALAAEKRKPESILHDRVPMYMPLLRHNDMQLLPGNAAEAVIDMLNERGMFEL